MLERLTFAFTVAVLATACVSTVSIDVDDNSARFTQLSGSVLLDEDSGSRVRFRWTQVEGDDEQTLDAGERVRVGSSEIDGPAVVGIDLDLNYYSIALGTDGDLYESFNISTYIGISQTDFDLTLTESGRSFDRRDDTTELYVQFGATAKVAESLDFGFAWALSLGREFSGIEEIDLRLDYRLARNLVVSGGYRWFNYQYGLGSDDSNLEVEFRGPFIGLYLPF